MLMTGRGARKQIGLEMRTEDGVANLRALSGQEDLESAPHGDTVEYSLIRSAFSFYEKLKAKIIRRLILEGAWNESDSWGDGIPWRLMESTPTALTINTVSTVSIEAMGCGYTRSWWQAS